MSFLITNYYLELLALYPILLVLAGEMIVVGIDPYIRKQQKRTMLLLCILVFSLILQDFSEYLTIVKYRMILLRTLLATYGYCIRPVILLLFLHIVEPQEKTRYGWILVSCNAAIYLISIFTNICFRIDEDNKFHGGVFLFEDTCMIVSAVLLAALLYVTLRRYQASLKETWIPVLVTLVILTAIYMDANTRIIDQPVSFLTISIVACCGMFYNWLHLQFAREHEKGRRAKQRIQVMMSQIQPHFLYNTLSTIQVLCETDPPKAVEITENFAQYLRQNIDWLGQAENIPFQKEMEHTQTYAAIEMVRFPNIHLELDLQDTQFNLPALTIQPMVENAIRHGVRIRKNGLVRVITRRKPGWHEIRIEDNGKGFDVETAKKKPGSHIGVQNVRERIEQISKGTMTIESTPGVGTSVTIRIPVEENR